jgi:type IV secretory pathway TrbF-like protein
VYGQGIILFDADATKNFIVFTPLESLTLEYLIAHSPEFCSARDIFHAIKPDGSLSPDYRKHVGNFIAGIRSKSTAWLILSQRGSHAGYRAIPVNSETASRKPDSPSTQG